MFLFGMETGMCMCVCTCERIEANVVYFVLDGCMIDLPYFKANQGKSENACGFFRPVEKTNVLTIKSAKQTTCHHSTCSGHQVF